MRCARPAPGEQLGRSPRPGPPAGRRRPSPAANSGAVPAGSGSPARSRRAISAAASAKVSNRGPVTSYTLAACPSRSAPRRRRRRCRRRRRTAPARPGRERDLAGADRLGQEVLAEVLAEPARRARSSSRRRSRCDGPLAAPRLLLAAAGQQHQPATPPARASSANAPIASAAPGTAGPGSRTCTTERHARPGRRPGRAVGPVERRLAGAGADPHRPAELGAAGPPRGGRSCRCRRGPGSVVSSSCESVQSRPRLRRSIAQRRSNSCADRLELTAWTRSPGCSTGRGPAARSCCARVRPAVVGADRGRGAADAGRDAVRGEAWVVPDRGEPVRLRPRRHRRSSAVRSRTRSPTRRRRHRR